MMASKRKTDLLSAAVRADIDKWVANILRSKSVRR